MKPKYKRVLLKLSGEALAGKRKFGIDEDVTRKLALQVKDIVDTGVETAVVVGGEISGEAEAARIWTGQPLTMWVCLQRL